MLRQLVGDDAFFRGLHRYYNENRFAKAGTSDLQRAMEEESGKSLDRFFERWIYDSTLPRVRATSVVDDQEVIVRVEQLGDIFDVPILVSITYTDGRIDERVIAVTEASTEVRIPRTGTVRQVELNQDNGALVTIEKR
jgi:aminopeptidase N